MPARTPPPIKPSDRFGSWLRGVRSESGITLIEVLVSALMVALIASAAAGALIATAGFSGDQRLRSQADELAAQDQDRLRGMSDEQLNGLNQTRTVSLSDASFTVNSVATYEDTTGDSSCASTAAAYYKIASTVSWTENGGTTSGSIVENSLLARPVTGDLRTQVTDQTKTGLSGLTVTASGASPQTGLTDSNGCILFAGLTPGSYTESIADPGYVTPSGTPTPLTATATVTTSGMAVPTGSPFELGVPGTIVGTFTTYNGSPGQADGLSWAGSDSVNSTTGTVPSSAPATPVTGATTTSLFPFDKSTTSTPSYANNYAVWGGRCADQEPTPSPSFASVNPGGTGTAASAKEPLMDLTMTYAGASKKPTLVKETFNGGGCTDTWEPTITTASSVPSTGWLADPGQPYAPAGDLTVCVQYTSGTKTYISSITTLGNTSMTAANAFAFALTSSSTQGSC